MKFTILLSILFLSLGTGPVYSENKEILSLDEVVDYSLKNNIPILESEQSLIIAKQGVREARLVFLPQFLFTGDVAKANVEYPTLWGAGETYREALPYEKSRMLYGARAYMLLPVYTGGRNVKNLELYKNEYQKEQIKYQAARSSAAWQARAAFYKALFSKELSSFYSLVFLEAEAAFRDIPSSSEAYPEALSDMIKIRDWKKYSARDLADAMSELYSVTGRENEFDIKGELLPIKKSGVDFRKMLVFASEKRPELKEELYKSRADDLNLGMAVIRKYPDIYLGASYDIFGEGYSYFKDPNLRKENFMAFLSIRYPFPYDFWTEIQKKKAVQRQSELRRARLENSIREEVEKAYRDYEFYSSKCEENKVSLSAAEAFLNSSRGKNKALFIKGLITYCEIKRGNLEDIYNQIKAAMELGKSTAWENF